MSKVTTQVATGLARGKYDRVAFDVSVEGRGGTGPKAKTKAQETVTKSLNSALALLQKNGVVFDKNDHQSSFSVTQHFEYDNSGRRPAGYLATFSLHLETSQVERASEIQDVLTSVEGANVSDPSFMLQPENRRTLQKVAVTEAFAVAQERFQEECGVLGLKPMDFEIEDWNVGYGQGRFTPSTSNAMCDVAGAESAGGSEPLEVNSGLASVQVTLTLGFRRVG